MPCRACCQPRGGLLPHRFTLTASTPAAVCSLWRFPWGRPRRALPGTIASWSPDFPRPPNYPQNEVMGGRGHPTHRAASPLSRTALRGQQPLQNPVIGSCILACESDIFHLQPALALAKHRAKLGRSQVVRHRFLVPRTVGSNPTAPASHPMYDVRRRLEPIRFYLASCPGKTGIC